MPSEMSRILTKAAELYSAVFPYYCYTYLGALRINRLNKTSFQVIRLSASSIPTFLLRTLGTVPYRMYGDHLMPWRPRSWCLKLIPKSTTTYWLEVVLYTVSHNKSRDAHALLPIRFSYKNPIKPRPSPLHEYQSTFVYAKA